MRYIFPGGTECSYDEAVTAIERVMRRGRGNYVRPDKAEAFLVLRQLIWKGSVKEKTDA